MTETEGYEVDARLYALERLSMDRSEVNKTLVETVERLTEETVALNSLMLRLNDQERQLGLLEETVDTKVQSLTESTEKVKTRLYWRLTGAVVLVLVLLAVPLALFYVSMHSFQQRSYEICRERAATNAKIQSYFDKSIAARPQPLTPEQRANEALLREAFPLVNCEPLRP